MADGQPIHLNRNINNVALRFKGETFIYGNHNNTIVDPFVE
jgi:hypothetical protein